MVYDRLRLRSTLGFTAFAPPHPHLNIRQRRFHQLHFRLPPGKPPPSVLRAEYPCRSQSSPPADPFSCTDEHAIDEALTPADLLASERGSRKARHRLSSASPSAYAFRRRWTALGEPYRWGNSLQGAPVHRIQRTPSKHRRSSSGGRPPLRWRGRWGSCALIYALIGNCAPSHRLPPWLGELFNPL